MFREDGEIFSIEDIKEEIKNVKEEVKIDMELAKTGWVDVVNTPFCCKPFVSCANFGLGRC